MALTCPHCKYEHDCLDDPSSFPWTEDAEPEFHCWSCGEKFWIKTHVSITWEAHATEEEYELS